MPVTTVTKDPDALTMTIVADFPVPVRRLWDAYADPRQLERFWGPVEWPATFTRHDLFPGGESHYYMTGPAGERSGGYFEFLSVDPGRSFEVLDGFRTPDGARDAAQPTMRMAFTFEETASGSRVTTTTHFDSAEELETLLGMGMEEGTLSAMGQMDEVLADLRSFASGHGVQTQLIGEDRARITRVVRGSKDRVWRAHHDPELLRRWQLGPDGWTMPVCEVGTAVGDTYRFEWEREGGGDRFGFTGEVLELEPPHRAVTTETMIGQEGAPVVNELTLTEVEGGTLVTVLMTFPEGLRETVLGTGMADGMEASYARLETEVLATA
ncbi:ATPase [Citricoccus sp. SGAir0253]|uniref:SRPBCC family protein n=1 Tax=Citricoccus sp. SGAir0253 TaxID=2567881 RepID=UPI0010CD17AC|nr:SRPBCC family protein [Citricoccus sp. SGAir0253]QCU77665.1 ATPase [Citricoccus sp. SGAir0253]